MTHKSSKTIFMAAVVIAGLVCLVTALLTFPRENLDLKFLILFCFTIGIGSRVTIRIPRFKSHIAVSDTFLFLALLMFGGELAIILSAVEAFFSSWRFCNKKITVLFNSAAMAISMSCVVIGLKVIGFSSVSQMHGYGKEVQTFLIALSLIAITQFLVNTAL